MRDCPVCANKNRNKVFSMDYKIPDGWPLPDRITWYTCRKCGMIYGDGDFDQALLDEYYTTKYGYGIYHRDNVKRLQQDALEIAKNHSVNSRVVDFGGAGDDGSSVMAEILKVRGFPNVFCIGAGDELPEDCDVIYASHVLEHIYDLPAAMDGFAMKLSDSGSLIVDVPDSTGLLQRWKMPILDFNTKHINHFTLRNLLDLGHEYGFESVSVKFYELEYAPCFQVHFRRLDVAKNSRSHIAENMAVRIDKLRGISGPVNVWGMSDIVWHLLSKVGLDVLNYIDNDPAYRGQTYNGIPVLERPDNDAPIVIMAQGQRHRLIENIRKMGITSEIIEI